MSARVKICGLRDEATIEKMNGLAIDEVGLMFAPSKRQVSKKDAYRLIESIHRITNDRGVRPLAAGVFVNTELAELSELLAALPLDIVQLHGQESTEYCAQLKERFPSKAIWRVVSIRPDSDSATDGQKTPEVHLAPYAGLIDAILIDTAGGGTGQPFNWAVIEAYKRAAASLGLPLHVAGGLHEGNVQELLHKHQPDGVDVSSGVETDGRKDIEKIRLFVRRVREA